MPSLTELLVGAGRYYVHRNLHRKDWTLRKAGAGRITGHSPCVLLSDVELRVRPGGREKARSEGRKNVHAFAIGHVEKRRKRPIRDAVELSYSPFNTVPSFYDVRSRSAVTGAEMVELTPSGKLYAWGVRYR